jgi:hypothetical protein
VVLPPLSSHHLLCKQFLPPFTPQPRHWTSTNVTDIASQLLDWLWTVD